MGCKILKLVTWPLPRPFQGRLVSHYTRFEVSRFTFTKLWMAVQNAENGVVLGGTQGRGQCHHSIERIRRYTDVSLAVSFPYWTVPGQDVSRRTFPVHAGRFPYTSCLGIVFLEKCLFFTLFINSHKLFVPVEINLNIYALNCPSSRYALCTYNSGLCEVTSIGS